MASFIRAEVGYQNVYSDESTIIKVVEDTVVGLPCARLLVETLTIGKYSHFSLVIDTPIRFECHQLSNLVKIKLYLEQEEILEFENGVTKIVGPLAPNTTYLCVAENLASSNTSTNIGYMRAFNIQEAPIIQFGGPDALLEGTLAQNQNVSWAVDQIGSTLTVNFNNYPVSSVGNILCGWINKPLIEACEVAMTPFTGIGTDILPQQPVYTRYNVGDLALLMIKPVLTGSYSGIVQFKIYDITNNIIPIFIQSK